MYPLFLSRLFTFLFQTDLGSPPEFVCPLAGPGPTFLPSASPTLAPQVGPVVTDAPVTAAPSLAPVTAAPSVAQQIVGTKAPVVAPAPVCPPYGAASKGGKGGKGGIPSTKGTLGLRRVLSCSA
jgi:hypothetical protein